MKNILIINGHPDKKSFCYSLAESYKKGTDSKGDECRLVHLIDLKFNPILTYGYRLVSELEPDLVKMQEYILKADHFVFVYPNWWGTFPALLKGFFDRVLLPNFAFKFHDNDQLWDKLLIGKTARIIVTMDTPKLLHWWIYRSAGHLPMKTGILDFCGIKPVKVTAFSPMNSSSATKRKKWLKVVEILGRNQQ